MRRRQILLAENDAHGGHETVEVRDVRGTNGGRGLRGGPGKKVGVISSGRPHNIWYRYRPTGQ